MALAHQPVIVGPEKRPQRCPPEEVMPVGIHTPFFRLVFQQKARLDDVKYFTMSIYQFYKNHGYQWINGFHIINENMIRILD